MALQANAFYYLHPPFPLSSPPQPSPPSIFKPQRLSLTPSIQTKRRTLPPLCVVEDQNKPSSEPEPESEEPELTDLASELKKAMQERKEKEGESFWNGVVEEISEIQWPEFGKVLGTTGVVLSVIFGSSVVLLTVNAILAELSDKVFAGKGIQDFFA